MCEHGNVADVLLWLEELPHLLSSSELVYFALMVDNVPRAVHFRDREILMQFVADLMSRCKCLEVVEVHWPSEPALGHSWWRREEPQLVEIEEDVFEINEDLAIEISEGLGKAIRAQHWHEDPQDHPFGARMEKLIT
ncbi:hypothetical protein PUNSTDRAFT_55785 [Punctularia strigosozonata HHB-11173 SS5]|uniref:Uncharacterized protein n=1 Tax=Punctularia strigosozonata (strain HHB-11173) TaxID=741275 RepID=R7S247_PUNST|nr:uncharacterized protein PUNSTDRAFT_55785 [Punctularia strigosozonata HHB-11173 SS5]EIN03939.1 hypothetical protein PUNSTDRAFT_55785 [Punctularia strigosozonata HHB-11173 SS5]